MGARHLLVKRHDDQRLLFDTFVQQENQVARVIWAATEPMHRPIVLHVLDQGSRRQALTLGVW